MSLVAVPHPCVVLAITAGVTSGWCILRRSEPVHFGEAKKAAERTICIKLATELSSRKEPLVAVIQRKPGQSGVSRGRWLEALELGGLSKKRILVIHEYAWRRRHQAAPGDGIALCPTRVQEATELARWASTASDVRELLPRRKPKIDEPVRIPYLKVYEPDG